MGDYVNVKELFGCDVFNDSVMQETSSEESLQGTEENHRGRQGAFHGNRRCGCS